jgi:2'-5' RNA ligase
MELETALLIIPPAKVQTFAYPIRELHDAASFNQVPAHITLLYPFVPPDQVDEAIARLTPLCASFPPFEVVIDSYGRFNDTLFLEPSNPKMILELYKLLIKTFPEYPAYEGEHGPELRPHLTLARFEKPEEGDAIELPPTPTFTFIVKQLHLYLGTPNSDAPFIPRAVIPLGKKT